MQNIKYLCLLLASPLICNFSILLAKGEEATKAKVASALTFHASFDENYDADYSLGDGRMYTAQSIKRALVRLGNDRKDVEIAREEGRYGGALRFLGVSKKILYYKAEGIGYEKQDWSGTVSFWLKLDPNKDLKPGYCDPLQITQRGWNDAALFIDFDKDLPRDMRLGVFSDIKKWNPGNIPWEEIPVDERPMVVVKRPPFSSSEWTHVLFTFQGINPKVGSETPGLGSANLYLNGKWQGTLHRPLHFQWDVSQAGIMIGIQYIGDFDDLAIFDRALSTQEIQLLTKLTYGVKEIRLGSGMKGD